MVHGVSDQELISFPKGPNKADHNDSVTSYTVQSYVGAFYFTDDWKSKQLMIPPGIFSLEHQWDNPSTRTKHRKVLSQTLWLYSRCQWGTREKRGVTASIRQSLEGHFSFLLVLSKAIVLNFRHPQEIQMNIKRPLRINHHRDPIFQNQTIAGKGTGENDKVKLSLFLKEIFSPLSTQRIQLRGEKKIFLLACL